MGFHGFSRFQVGFSRFQMGFESKSWLQVGFYSDRSVFHGSRWFFMAPGPVSMIPSGFLSSLRVPGWFKYALSAAGAKCDVENTQKGTHFICILAPQSR